jgi:hypothetical protein
MLRNNKNQITALDRNDNKPNPLKIQTTAVIPRQMRKILVVGWEKYLEKLFTGNECLNFASDRPHCGMRNGSDCRRCA